MIVTSIEAKDKECRAYQPVTVRLEYAGDYLSINYCIANSCMHWNWVDGEALYGYCGLGGKN